MHFKSPLVIILLIAGIITGVFGEYANTIIILTIIFVSVILDYYQESKAEKAAQLLKQKVTTTATVLRDNVKQEIPFPEIVPGDIIYLSAGDIAPADSRVISAKDLFINQSSLTGESFPVEKIAGSIKGKQGSITEWNNSCFMGTSVVSGTATALVVRTGGATEYGKIAKKLIEKAPETEFERGHQKLWFSYNASNLPFGYICLLDNFPSQPNYQRCCDCVAIRCCVGSRSNARTFAYDYNH